MICFVNCKNLSPSNVGQISTKSKFLAARFLIPFNFPLLTVNYVKLLLPSH